MQTFRLTEHPYQVPERWAELTPDQFFAAAPHLGQESLAARLAVLRAWCPKLPNKHVRRLTPDQLWELLTLVVGWIWKQELDTKGVTEFTHRKCHYQLPAPQLLDAVSIEYAMASVYFHQFASPKRPQQLALDQLVTTLCRPLRADLAQVQQDPAWGGQRRERYNAKLAEARALELADAPLGVKIVVLHQFLSAQRFIHRGYKELLKKVEPPEPARPRGRWYRATGRRGRARHLRHLRPGGPHLPAHGLIQPGPTSPPPARSREERVGMHISDKGLALIKKEEKFMSRRYLYAAGKPTISYGHVIQASEAHLNTATLTEPEASKLLEQDVARQYGAHVSRRLKRAVTQNQFDALVSLCFNIGTGGFD
jgi:hypothetical protein